MNLAADLAARAQQRGWVARPAFYEGDQVWTHGEVHDLAERTASVLAGRGVGPGDRVLIALPDGIAWVTTFLAVARLGAVAVLANPGITPAEHGFMAKDSEAVLCVTGPDLEAGFDADRWLGSDRLSVLVRTASPAAAQPVDSETPLYIQYTSGTTGRPKGVVHSHGDPQAYHDLVGEQVLRISADDVALSVSKLYFAYGFGNAFAFPLFSGSAAVLVAGRPTPALVGELVARHRVTLLYSVPSAYAALVDEQDPAHFTSVRAAITAGEGIPAELGDRLSDLISAPVLEQIGSTEVGHAFCANSVDYNMPGTVGRPVPGYEVELRDAAGTPVEDGAVGELWVRGPTLVRQYLNPPVGAERTLVAGWLATHDRACRNPDGTYLHLGRTDDLVMVGGITVSPLEVEDVLRGHPAVAEVAVAAIADDLGATRLCAFVVPVSTSPDARVIEDELITLARRQLASFKVPRTVRLVSSLPRTHTGKLRRHLVRQGAW